MNALHFSVREIAYTYLPDGYKIVVTTDIPCHLWMRWTTNKPWKHIIPVLRRGIQMHGDVYFCFNAYHDNEQEEPGDTLVHTFIKLGWDACTTRYFYFLGDINEQDSPSTTAIFTKHRPFPLPPPTLILCFEDNYTIFPNPPDFTLCFDEKWW